ncbi:MAG: wax ester/triacylglycerol synthase domain-containing protein [Microthrixaceae bacterium]
MSGASMQQDRMSGIESFMWELERDPQLSSAFANLTLFDRAPDRAVFRRRMAQAVEAVPRLRQRVVDGPAPWDLPRWVEDEQLDLDHHLRWVDLGGEGTREELHELAATLARQPFDRERPLWEFVTIEGLVDGRAAMLQRLHHTITDGEGGIRLSVEFLDLERAPSERRPRRDRPHGRHSAEVPAAAGPWWSRAAGSIGSVATSAVGTAASLPSRTGDLAGMAQSTLRQALVGHRRSPLWTERSLDRWFGTTTLSLDDARDAAHRLGGTVNDLFVAGAVDAAGQVHRDAGSPVDELRMSMPVSTRTDRSVSNAFSPTQMLVPTGPMEPAARLAQVHRTVDGVRSERSIDVIEGAANAAAHLPAPLLRRTGRYLTDSVDFVCSNVRAAPFDLFIAGAFMEANYPMGPLAGTAFNLTTMSYRGWLFLGLTVDTAAVPHPEHLLTRLDEAYDRLLAAAGLPRRTPAAC